MKPHKKVAPRSTAKATAKPAPPRPTAKTTSKPLAKGALREGPQVGRQRSVPKAKKPASRGPKAIRPLPMPPDDDGDE